MDDKQLKRLIQSVDAPPPTAESAAALAARLPALHRRRRRRNIAASAAIAVVFGCALWRLVPRGPVNPPRPAAAQIDVAAIRAEIRQTDAEIARREQTVKMLLAAERLNRLEQQLAILRAQSPLLPVGEEQIGRIAASYLVSGDEKREIGLPLALAKEDYRRVVELFPGTTWANEAKARLTSLPH